MDQSSNGTSSTFRKLSSSEQQQLALIKGTPIYDLFIKAVDLYQKDKAILTMATTNGWDNVVRNQGEITGSAFLVYLIDHAADKQEKAVTAKKATETQEEAK